MLRSERQTNSPGDSSMSKCDTSATSPLGACRLRLRELLKQAFFQDLGWLPTGPAPPNLKHQSP